MFFEMYFFVKGLKAGGITHPCVCTGKGRGNELLTPAAKQQGRTPLPDLSQLTDDVLHAVSHMLTVAFFVQG